MGCKKMTKDDVGAIGVKKVDFQDNVISGWSLTWSVTTK